MPKGGFLKRYLPLMVWAPTRLLDSLIEHLLHVFAAAVVPVRGIDRVVHRYDQRFVLWDILWLRTQALFLIFVQFPTFGHVRIQAHDDDERIFEGPIDVGS